MRRVVQVQGLLRLEGPLLVIEWSGSVKWTEIRGPEVQNRSEAIAATRREIPVEKLADVSVRGWWRLRFELRARDLAVLDGVPTAAHGRASFRIPRAERAAAQSLAANLTDEIANAELRAAEGA
jgi:hypothetical protein